MTARILLILEKRALIERPYKRRPAIRSFITKRQASCSLSGTKEAIAMCRDKSLRLMTVLSGLLLLAESSSVLSAAQSGRTQRLITFNGGPLDERGWRVLNQLEALARTRLPDGAYWYDPLSGASGRWGGPAAILLLPGLPLGGRLPA